MHFSARRACAARVGTILCVCVVLCVCVGVLWLGRERKKSARD